MAPRPDPRLPQRTDDTPPGPMQIARGADGWPVHVSDARNGKGCHASCYGCGEAVLARQGDIQTWGFAHDSGSACSGGAGGLSAGETALHGFAKDVIATHRRLLLPEVRLPGGDTLHRDRIVTFDHVALEVPMDGFQPDAVAEVKGKALAVEFAVTHRAGPTKVQRARDTGMAMVEIDLSGLRASEEDLCERSVEIASAIMLRAPRTWLHNPAIEREMARRQEQAQQARLAAEALAEQAEMEQRRRETRQWSLAKGVLTDLPVEGDHRFSVARETWQAAILARLPGPTVSAQINLRQAVQALRERGMIAPFPDGRNPSDLTIADLEWTEPAYRAVRGYLRLLARAGLAQADAGDPDRDPRLGSWKVTVDRTRVEDRALDYIAANRHRVGDPALHDLGAPAPEIDRWRAPQQMGFDLVVDEERARDERMARKLAALLSGDLSRQMALTI